MYAPDRLPWAGLLAWILVVLTACDPYPKSPDCRLAAPESDRQADAGCVVLQQGHLLVLRNRFGGDLGIPSGGRNARESAQCTAHRETWEETGLDLRVGRELGRLHGGFTVYHCHPDQDLDPASAPELPWHARVEVTEALWMRIDQIPPGEWRYENQMDAFMELVHKANTQASPDP